MAKEIIVKTYRDDDGNEVKVRLIKFGKRPSVLDPIHLVETWWVSDEKSMDGYGYLMLCEVNDRQGNHQFTGGGETFELAFYAKQNHDDYPILWEECQLALNELGITDMNICLPEIGDEF